MQKVNIAEIKQEYIESVREKSIGYENLVMYGAGSVSRILYQILQHSDIDIDAFCVTDTNENCREQFGKLVYSFADFPFEKEDTLILVAVFDPWNKEVKDTLEKAGYAYLDVPPNALEFDSDRSYFNRPLLEITTKVGCSVNCHYCPQKLLISQYLRDKGSVPVYMTRALFQCCIDKLPRNTIISFAGFAEAFLNPEAIFMMEYASAQRFTVFLYTTLVGCTMDVFQRVLKIPFAKVVLHVPDEDGYAKIPMTEEYFAMLEMALEANKANGEPFLYTANCQGRPHHKILEAVKGRITITSQLFDRAGNLSGEKNLKSVEWIQGDIRCNRSPSLQNGVLIPDGSVYLCAEDYGLKYKLGNLQTESYKDIIQGSGRKYVLDAMKGIHNERPLLCRQCIYAEKNDV